MDPCSPHEVTLSWSRIQEEVQPPTGLRQSQGESVVSTTDVKVTEPAHGLPAMLKTDEEAGNCCPFCGCSSNFSTTAVLWATTLLSRLQGSGHPKSLRLGFSQESLVQMDLEVLPTWCSVVLD